MAKNQPVPASEFTRNFGHYRMVAQRDAVAVSSHGRITGYFVPPEEYQDFLRFKAARKSFATVELPEERVREIARTRMSPRHNHLNAILDRD